MAYHIMASLSEYSERRPIRISHVVIRTQIPMVFPSRSKLREPATYVRDEGIHHLRKLSGKRTLEILQTLGQTWSNMVKHGQTWSNTTLS